MRGSEPVALFGAPPAPVKRVETIDPKLLHMTNLYEHHWQTVNPVTCEALVQLTLGGPQPMYNGGMLHTTVRYFDAERRRAWSTSTCRMACAAHENRNRRSGASTST